MPITAIYGPHCVEVLNQYIAHETDTAEAEVPIVEEDGTTVLLPENASGTISGTPCFPGDETCCNKPMQIPFEQANITEIFITQSVINQVGAYPAVEVWYFDNTTEDGGLVKNVFSNIAYVGDPPTKIVVDHGGPSTGIIKLS